MEEKETRFDRSTERSECLIAEYKKLRKDEAKMSQKSLSYIASVTLTFLFVKAFLRQLPKVAWL